VPEKTTGPGLENVKKRTPRAHRRGPPVVKKEETPGKESLDKRKGVEQTSCATAVPA